MVVKNNLSALNTLNTLNKNDSAMAKSLRKVSTGMRINGAGDDASAYSISERMQVRIRGLGQCDNNTKTGKSLLTLAERAVNEQVQIAQKLKEIALKATDDTYSDADRDVLQSETTHMLMQLNTIAYETNYNGMQVLSGAVQGEVEIVLDPSTGIQDNAVGNDVVPQPVAPNIDTSGRGITGYVPYPYSYSNGPFYDPTALPVATPISFTFASGAGTFGTTALASGSTVYDTSGNPYTVQVDPSTRLVSAYDSTTSTYTPIVDSAGNGYNSVTRTTVPTAGMTPNNYGYPQITTMPPAAGTAVLTSSTLPMGSIYEYNEEPYSGRGTITRLTSMNPNVYDTNLYSGSIFSEKLDFSWATNIPSDLAGQGLSMLCGACGQFVSFKFDDTIANSSSEYYASPDGSELYVIGVSDLANATDIPQFLMDGVKNAIGRPADSPPAANATKLANTGHPINLYMDTNVSPNEIYVQKPTTPTLVLYNGTIGDLVPQGGMKPYKDFFIQGDTKSSQETRLQLPNTTLDMLFPSRASNYQVDPEPSDYPIQWPEDYQQLSDLDREYYSKKYHLDNDEAIRREKWRDEVWPYPRRGAVASASCVRTRMDANKFLEDIDQAIKYLLHCGTNLGAQCQRMDSMNDNIVTGHENTQASESTMRDADMAKEMVTYTKNNVLSQTAQSMLSQANQNTSSVLDILQ